MPHESYNRDNRHSLETHSSSNSSIDLINTTLRRRPRINRSLGSGVIVKENGIVITNHHVIREADEVKVALHDGREMEAEIVFTDEESDLAVIKIKNNEKFNAIKLDDSEKLEVGDLVLAVGNPFGVGQTVTSGIVSALARSQGGINDFGFFIQTDASINPGNSGGALVNMNGKLVGINTSIFTRSGGSNGIGFAIPANMVQVALDSLEAGSDILIRPWIGAKFTEVTAEIAQAIKLNRPKGALVEKVHPNAPADIAGMKAGDVILELDDNNVPHMHSLGYLLATAGIGRNANVKILRGEREINMIIKLEQPPESPKRDIRTLQSQSPMRGATIANISPRLATEKGIDPFTQGVVVVEVAPTSHAARFGVQKGDIIILINDTEIETTQQMEEYLKQTSQFSQIRINRKGRVITRILR